MTREEFDILVRHVETTFDGRPSALRRRVALLAAVGYGLLLAGLSLVALAAAGFFALIFWADFQGKIICGVAGTCILIAGGALLGTLLVRVPEPKGVPLSRDEAPALFGLLEDLHARLRSVPFHHVRLVPVHNAAVVQAPRLGMLGWSRNFLLLGLPLLEGHSPDEVRAILAHEFAHLSRHHGRFSHWIYRLRRSWESAFAHVSRPQARGQFSFRPLLRRLIELFWPRFNAHAFVFSRANEYEADALAASLAGADHMADALVRGALQDRLLAERFWPSLWQLANTQAAPPTDVFLRLRDALRLETPHEVRAGWLGEALRVPTTNADTHPCLADRLRALDRLPEASATSGPLPSGAAPEPSAAQGFLGPALDSLRSKVEEFWRADIRDQWLARHAKAGALTHALTSLEQAVPAPAADADSLWDKADLILDLRGSDSAEPILRQILSLQPAHVAANFHLGRLLLARGCAAGEAHLERAIAAEDELVPQACALLFEHYRRAGRPDQIRLIELRLDRHERQLARSRVERSEVTARDTFIPHGLSAEQLDSLRLTLSAEPGLARAELGRKELLHFPNQKLFLLCVHRRRSWPFPNAHLDQTLVTRLSQTIRLPGRVLVFARSGGFRSLARKLASLPNTEVFRRD